MAWCRLGALGLLLCAVPPSVGDEPPPADTTLAIAWAKDIVLKVEQKLELDNTNRGAATFAGGAGRAEMIVKGHVAITEEWTDRGTTEAEGRLTELQRAYKSSKLRAQKNAAVATSLQGATFALAPTGAGTEVRVLKGRPSDLAQRLLRASPLDPVELLLPKKPVAVGATWEIAVETLRVFQNAICVGCAGAQGAAAEDIGVLIAQLEQGGPAAVGKIVIGTWASLEGGVATLTFEDDKTHAAEGDKGYKGPLFDVPPSTTSITGTLTFHVGLGRPQRLAWSQVHESGDFTPPPSIGGPTVPGFKESWTLVKTWK